MAVSSDTGKQESNPTGLLNKVEDSSAGGKNGHKLRYNYFRDSLVPDDYIKVFKWVLYNSKFIVELQNHRMAWVGRYLKDYLVPTQLPWARAFFTRPGCLEPCPA